VPANQGFSDTPSWYGPRLALTGALAAFFPTIHGPAGVEVHRRRLAVLDMIKLSDIMRIRLEPR
jgi:hypothetical protein